MLQTPDKDSRLRGFEPRAFAKPRSPLQLSPSAPLLQLREIRLGFAHQPLFANLNFELGPSERVFIRGPVGAGKSSLLRLISGDLQADSGTRFCPLKETEIELLPQFRFQSQHLNFLLGEWAESSGSEHPLQIELLTPKQRKLAWNSASGGEKTLCLLEACLRRQPKLLLFDEVLGNLDSTTAAQAEEGILEYSRRFPKSSMLLVDHHRVADWATGVYELSAGQLYAVR
ncbi:MAG: ATP-binding cassette domain-containing protein [Bradymonadales bacterium]|nr:MAG: ATP-binding cassette domain-containing protein [Bradymonadales bacterium]